MTRISTAAIVRFHGKCVLPARAAGAPGAAGCCAVGVPDAPGRCKFGVPKPTGRCAAGAPVPSKDAAGAPQYLQNLACAGTGLPQYLHFTGCACIFAAFSGVPSETIFFGISLPQFLQKRLVGFIALPQCLQKFAISTPRYGLTSSKEPLIPSGQLIVPKAYI